MTKQALATLERRGLVHQKTAEDLGDVLDAKPIAFYNGFDPTAASLHVGHMLPVMAMRRLRRAGHKAIALIGGATGMIGDPSGKSAERNLLDLDLIRANADAIEEQLARLLGAEEGDANPPIYVNNIDWLGPMGLLDFLRDVGKHFSVNAMVNKDSVRQRFERDGDGISFTEFSYALLQGYDFLELHRRYGCVLQTGGSDQWGNIVGGVDLVRRSAGARAFGLTVPLLTNSDGKKFGKSEQGAVFLDPALTSPYAFHQFWINVADADVVRLLNLFTDYSDEEVAALGAEVGSGARPAQRALARAMCDMVHGRDETVKAEKAAEALFSGDVRGLPAATLLEVFAEAPSLELPRGRAADGVGLLDLLAETGLCGSKGDARRQLQQNAVRINGEATEERLVTTADFLDGGVLVLKRGKKNYALVRLVD